MTSAVDVLLVAARSLDAQEQEEFAPDPRRRHQRAGVTYRIRQAHQPDRRGKGPKHGVCGPNTLPPVQRLQAGWTRLPATFRFSLSLAAALMTVLSLPTVADGVSGWATWLGFVGAIAGSYIVPTLGLLGLLTIASLQWAELRTRRRPATPPAEIMRFHDFAARFTGWVRSQEIVAPPDMTVHLGKDWEEQQLQEWSAGTMSQADYERRVRPFTVRKAWLQQVRSDYQRNWRVEAERYLGWAVRSGHLPGAKERLQLITAEDPREWEDFKRLAALFERVAGRLVR